MQINSNWIIELNVRTKTINFLEEKIGESLHDLGLRGVLRYDIMKEKKTDFIQIKKISALKDTIKKMKIQATDYLQIIYLIKDLFLEYIKNPYNSITRRQTTQFKSRQKIYIDILPKKIYEWPLSP